MFVCDERGSAVTFDVEYITLVATLVALRDNKGASLEQAIDLNATTMTSTHACLN